MAGVQTPFGVAPTVTIADDATYPTAMLVTTPSAAGGGTAEVAPFDLPRVASAPNYNPSLVLGRPRAVFCTGDSKIYVWISGTTWKASAALA